jgi:hypothetical protein
MGNKEVQVSEKEYGHRGNIPKQKASECGRQETGRGESMDDGRWDAAGMIT